MEFKREDIYEKVIDIMVDQLGVEKQNISDASEIIGDLGADSLDVVDIVQVLEDEFSIKVPNDEIEHLKTVGDIVDYIENNV